MTIDEAIRALERDELQDLVLKRLPLEQINNATIERLADAIKKSTRLISIHLSEFIYNTQGAILIMTALKNHNTIRFVSLTNSVLPQGSIFLLITNVLKDHSKITHLNLKGTGINTRQAKEIFKMLERNQNITSLNLSDNAICDGAMRTAAWALRKNTTLKRLSVRNNKFSAIGFKRLIIFLTNNRVIEEIDIMGGPEIVMDSIASLCADLLKNNKVLRLFHASLRDNHLDGIADAMKHNHSLLSLGHCGIHSIDGMQLLSRYLERNIALHLSQTLNNLQINLMISTCVFQETMPQCSVLQTLFVKNMGMFQSVLQSDTHHQELRCILNAQQMAARQVTSNFFHDLTTRERQQLHDAVIEQGGLDYNQTIINELCKLELLFPGLYDSTKPSVEDELVRACYQLLKAYCCFHNVEDVVSGPLIIKRSSDSEQPIQGNPEGAIRLLLEAPEISDVKLQQQYDILFSDCFLAMARVAQKYDTESRLLYNQMMMYCALKSQDTIAFKVAMSGLQQDVSSDMKIISDDELRVLCLSPQSILNQTDLVRYVATSEKDLSSFAYVDYQQLWAYAEKLLLKESIVNKDEKSVLQLLLKKNRLYDPIMVSFLLRCPAILWMIKHESGYQYADKLMVLDDYLFELKAYQPTDISVIPDICVSKKEVLKYCRRTNSIERPQATFTRLKERYLQMLVQHDKSARVVNTTVAQSSLGLFGDRRSNNTAKGSLGCKRVHNTVDSHKDSKRRKQGDSGASELKACKNISSSMMAASF